MPVKSLCEPPVPGSVVSDRSVEIFFSQAIDSDEGLQRKFWLKIRPIRLASRASEGLVRYRLNEKM